LLRDWDDSGWWLGGCPPRPECPGGEENGITRRDIEFDAEGVTLRGWFYAAEAGSAPEAAVVMAHGFSAVEEMYLDVFAEVFAGAAHPDRAGRAASRAGISNRERAAAVAGRRDRPALRRSRAAAMSPPVPARRPRGRGPLPETELAVLRERVLAQVRAVRSGQDWAGWLRLAARLRGHNFANIL
jgi:hypothetical protein